MDPERIISLISRCFRVTVLVLTTTVSSFSQIIKNPDPSIQINHSDCALLLLFNDKGNFALDDILLTHGNPGDSIFIVNLEPKAYSGKFYSQSASHVINFIAFNGDILEIRMGNDTMSSAQSEYLRWYHIEDLVAGKRVSFIIPGTFFFTAEFSLLNNQWVKNHGSSLKSFNSFTFSGGYQPVPGFFIGLGISYLNTDLPFWSYYYPYSQDGSSLKNVSLLPIYLNIRTHLSKKRVAPFFKFDIGMNILLTPRESTYTYESVYEKRYYTCSLSSGGFYFSPGFGFRVAVNRSVNILLTADFSTSGTRVENTSVYYNPSMGTYNPYSSVDRMWINSFKLKLGIGFQTKNQR